MKIGIAGGTGQLGYGLALRFLKEKYEVVVGSRQREKAEEAVAKLKAAAGLNEDGEDILVDLGVETIAAATIEECGQQCDIIFIAVPFTAQIETAKKLLPYATGKIVVDTTVPLMPGNPTQLQPMEHSAAEGVQNTLPDAKVVAGFHTVSHTLLSNLGKTLEGDVLICGDDAAAKETVIEIANRMGMRGLDAGPLINARTVERLTPMIIGMNKRYKRRHIGLHFTGLD